MFRNVNILCIALLFLCTVMSKNLTLHDYDNPSASHILDATIQDNLLIISGMLGGIEFYDISNSEVLNHLDNLQLSGGGGGSVKPNCIVASGDYAYVTTNQGLGVINISNPSNPQYLGIVSGTNGYILENLDVYENFLAIAAHEDGVLFYDISDPANPVEVGFYDTSELTGLYDGNWGTYAYLPSGNIISSDRQNGLFIFSSPLYLYLLIFKLFNVNLRFNITN